MPETAEIDDKALLSAFARDGSESAFRTLVDRHSGWVYAAAYRQLRDSHLAEDAAQAVFVLLCQRAKTMKPQQKVSGWLFMTVGYTVRSILRSQRRRRHYEQQAAAERPISYDPPPLAENLDEAVGRLSDSDRTAILLRFYQGRAFPSVARALGISEDTAKKRVARAIVRLRNRLGPAISPESLTTASAFGVPAASAALSAHVSQTALTTAAGAPVPPTIAPVLKGAGYLVAMTKIKIAAAFAILLLAIATAGTAVVLVMNPSIAPQTASLPAPTSPPTSQPTVQKVYSIRPNELIRAIPRPFSPVRAQVYKRYGLKNPPDSMVLGLYGSDNMAVALYGNSLFLRSEMEGPGPLASGYDLQSLAGILLDLRTQDIEGDSRRTIIPGDILYRQAASPEQLRAALEELAFQATNQHITFNFREVERAVIVFQGKWNPSIQKIQVYAKDLDTIQYDYGPRPTRALAPEIGQFIGESVFIEGQGVPDHINWNINYGEAQPADAALVCDHIHDQTGLIWISQTRTVRRLFIERQPP
jgi:RNA polymerase sigma factor (sigma-70 family)